MAYISKQKAYDYHAQMWDWIAQEMLTGRLDTPLDLKERAVKELGIPQPQASECYLCHYFYVSTKQRCGGCPLLYCMDIGSPYHELTEVLREAGFGRHEKGNTRARAHALAIQIRDCVL